LPFCHLHIKALRCPHPTRWNCTQVIPAEPQTLGQHLKRRRLQLHLMQAEVASRLCVHIESVKNWERGVTSPMIQHVPKIVEFLGYNPEQRPEVLAELIVYWRRVLGLTQEGLAQALAIDAVTVYRWEKGLSVPPTAKLRQLENLLP
jgi:transcriptional regulator with XRE-family HTH domain